MHEPFTALAEHISIADTPRETRLRMQIDRLRAHLDVKERRILVLEQRLRHWERRFIEVSEELRETRSAA